ncbi:hypothetical protein BDY24DRAFT_385744 [Mrakia frigida]|uniref:uncharacterized protein n=1 Tax=Mrakia frigida TaxID=29902 RepID=UPI003FCC0661
MLFPRFFPLNLLTLANATRRTFATMSEATDLNVLGGNLAKCSTRPQDPISGFSRDGYCRSYAMDGGKHTVAAIVSSSFLEFSKRAGNDLSTPRPDYGFPGLQEGCRWCLCVERWKEAFQAKGRFGDDIVPKVDLAATHIDALKTVSIEDLRSFEAPAPFSLLGTRHPPGR